MNGGGTTTSTQTSEPPAYVRPFLQQAATASQDLFNKGPQQYFPGSTVTPFSSQTQQALDLTQQRALSGSPVTQAAQGFAQRTLNNPITSQFGGASNPYLDQTFNRAADNVQNRIQSSFAGSGRNIEAGRPLAALELNDLAGQIYGGAYEGERNRMASDIGQQRGLQAGIAGLAPGLAQSDYGDLQALSGVGSQYDDLASRKLADEVSRYDYNQNAPGINLDQYIARLNNQPGGSSSATQPYFQNRVAGGLGGALAGYGLGSQFGNGAGGAWGAGIGGLLGLLG